MNEIKLVALFCYICECYNKDLRWKCQRFSNNSKAPNFTDEELLTIYIYAVIEEEKYKVKSIYNYGTKYLKSWFPTLPSYQAFNRRLNRLNNVFPLLVSILLQDAEKEGISFDISLIDSMPIITCSGKRKGVVAPNLTDKGYCSTKKLHYFGAKLHGIAFHRNRQLPLPEYFGLSLASEHDLNAVRAILPQLKQREVYADKAYCNQDLHQFLKEQFGISVFTPVKLIKGQTQQQRQFARAADQLFSTAVSKIRQPIESLFNWLIEKTQIQRASKVRSANGLIVHVFGKIAAAVSLWVNFNY